MLAEPVLAYANKEGHVIFTGAEKIALPARTAVQVAGIVNDHYNDLSILQEIEKTEDPYPTGLFLFLHTCLVIC